MVGRPADMTFISGNKLGFMMVVLAAPVALIGGFVLKLSDQLTMGLVGLWLIIMDGVLRLRYRHQAGWLTHKAWWLSVFYSGMGLRHCCDCPEYHQRPDAELTP